MSCCDYGCNGSKGCVAGQSRADLRDAFPFHTAQGVKSSPLETRNSDGSNPNAGPRCKLISKTEAVLTWLTVLFCAAICVYLIVCFLQFIGV